MRSERGRSEIGKREELDRKREELDRKERLKSDRDRNEKGVRQKREN